MLTLEDIEQELASRGLGAEGLQFAGTTGRSATNNNPLNLEYRPGSYQDKYGAELEPQPRGGSKPRFAKFPNMMAGYLAGLDQIRLDQSPQRGHTLASFVNKFAPPHENPTQQIVTQYAKALGVTPDTPLAEIPPEKLIVPMLARESSTRIVGPREKDIFNALLAKRTAPTQRAFQPYQIAAAGEQIPGPPNQGVTLADVDAEIAQRGVTSADIDKELAARQQTTTPGGWLDAAQKGLSGALDIVDIPSKYLLRKPLQYLHGQLMEPYRQKSEEEFGQYIQEPGAGAAAPEAFAPLPKQDVFVTPTEIALQGPLFGGIAKQAVNLPVKAAKVLYESAMKMPPKTIPNWLRKKIVETGLEEKIGVSQTGLEKTGDLIRDLNSQVSTIIEDAAAGEKTVDGLDVAKRLSSLKDYYADAPSYLKEPIMETLNNIQTKMILEGQIPLDKAQKMKQVIYELRKKSYGERKGYEIEADKAVARGLKETIAEQVPEISALNARESRLLDLQEVLDRAVNRSRNYDIIRMGDAIGAILGGSMAGPHGAEAGFLLRRLIDTPAMKARLGILLNSLGTNPFTSTAGFRYAAPGATLKPYLEEENK